MFQILSQQSKAMLFLFFLVSAYLSDGETNESSIKGLFRLKLTGERFKSAGEALGQIFYGGGGGGVVPQA